MKTALIFISTLFLFLGLYGTLSSSSLFASNESNSIAVASETSQAKYLSIKELDQFTAKENLRFTIRNAGGLLIPSSLE